MKLASTIRFLFGTHNVAGDFVRIDSCIIFHEAQGRLEVRNAGIGYFDLVGCGVEPVENPLGVKMPTIPPA
jgi:hypothetical protein